MNMKNIYLVLAIIGTVLPYMFFIPFVIEHGLNVTLFFSQLFENRISSFFGADVIVSSIVVISFVAHESKRSGVRNLWLPIAGTFLVGVSCGLPLFLYLKEKNLNRQET